VITVPSRTLRPEHALAYLGELQPRAREVALVGPGGVLLAGEEGAPARAARALQAGGAQRGGEDGIVAVRVDEHAIAAVLPAAAGALAEFDLGCVASAIGVRFDG
jgi:hypothetical protein